MALSRLPLENQIKAKHVESKWSACLDEGSTPSVSTKGDFSSKDEKSSFYFR